VTDRRGFLRGILAAGMAPAIVKAEILMPVRAPVWGAWDDHWLEAMRRQQIETAGLVCNPPLIIGELGQLERFTIISTPRLSDDVVQRHLRQVQKQGAQRWAPWRMR
jgi:hypothetical protein